jgi:uncharacterized membrane protein
VSVRYAAFATKVLANADEAEAQRFARGEINAEEYERSMEVLGNRRSFVKGGV